MKIWTVTTDEDGGRTSICYTQEAADAMATEIVTAWYDRCLRADEEPRDFTGEWREVYELLCDTIGFCDVLTVEEHDISDHPDLPSENAVIVWYEPQQILESGSIFETDEFSAPSVDATNDFHRAVVTTWMGICGPSAQEAMEEKFWDWIPRDLISLQQEIAHSLLALDDLNPLHNLGIIIGIRDPKVNPDFPGAFMVKECDTDWAIVGDDLEALVNEARMVFLDDTL
jgi:hypothetical protein